MKAAIVTTAGQPPVYGDFQVPQAKPGQQIIQVEASAISQVVKGRVAGKHYSASSTFPYVAGIDGIGRLSNGERVYFVLPDAPWGGMAELTLVSTEHCVTIPDTLDAVNAAASANPGMSSWAALTRRAQLNAGETVLINGATGTSGTLAVAIARHLGAGKIIVTGRNQQALATLLTQGADIAIELNDLATALPPLFKQGVDVVLDYLWGDSALGILNAAVAGGSKPVRFVQIGSLSGQQIPLHSHLLRSSALKLMGSGIGSLSVEQLTASVGELLNAMPQAGFSVPCQPRPLQEVTSAWLSDDSRCRTVFTL
ncbi:alcohol dehydrogenase [Izhakiella australiensis]|uniref:Alcohol dehydrogenase n=1 Tax=Izhakiella australiensis TaxID=1926881 RepID=A0A1S8YDZ0_9GAMM|nr:zinc-binding alcohol dehydrogenase family protein [Izhakiella australiensis]OON36978.1 alcohol dehydrogenase [Izhakiella australiensis]